MSRSVMRVGVLGSMLLAAAMFAVRCSSGSSGTAGAAAEDDTAALVGRLRLKSIPGIPTTLTPEKTAEIAAWRKTPGAWFVEKGCFGCHNVSVYGIKSEIGMGPDLSEAVQDVQTRFGMPLEKFLSAPVGTMDMVFSQMIPLTPEERTQALQHLQQANQTFLSRKAGS